MTRRLEAILAALTSLLVATSNATESVSDYFGFHTEIVRAKTTTNLSANVTRYPHSSFDRTVASLFGSKNQIGLKSGSVEADEPDIVWVKDGDMWFQIYYNEGWRGVGFGDSDLSGYTIPYSTFSIESRKDVDWYVVFAGYVKQRAMVYEAETGWNTFNRGYPMNIPLDESGIQFSKGFRWGDEKTGDILHLENDGLEESYYYSGRGWKKVGGTGYSGDANLSSTFFIETRGRGGQIIVQPPKNLRMSKTVSKTDTRFPPPDKPYIYLTIQNNFRGNPYFYAQWYAYNHKVRYTTEVLDSSAVHPTLGIRTDWFAVDSQTSFPWMKNRQILYTSASLLALRNGVGRVVASWDQQKRR